MEERKFGTIDFGEPVDLSQNIIKVVGVGGGGCNAVQNMYEEGIDGISFAVCNTDSQPLARSAVPVKLLLGKRGLGVGGVPEKGREEAESSLEQIKSLFAVEQYPNYDKLLKYIEEYRKAVGEQTDKQKEQQEQQKQEKVDVTNESSYAEQMLRLVNEEREKVGVSPLELDSTLTAAAQIRAKEIIEVFDHTRPNGKACKTVLEELGYEGDYAGENISKGTFEEPESAMELWMDSKGHRENILNPDYKYLGVGSDFESESNGLFDDIVSYWVQIFAR